MGVSIRLCRELSTTSFLLFLAESDDEWFDALEDIEDGATPPSTPTVKMTVDDDGGSEDPSVSSAIKLDLKFDVHKVRLMCLVESFLSCSHSHYATPTTRLESASFITLRSLALRRPF